MLQRETSIEFKLEPNPCGLYRTSRHWLGSAGRKRSSPDYVP